MKAVKDDPVQIQTTNMESAQTKKGRSKPTIITGHGQRATKKFFLQSGLAVIDYSIKNNIDSGPSNFMIDLLDSDGQQIDLVENEIVKNTNGSKAVQIPQDGSYLCSIKSNGTWTLKINQP
jgi:hypothetical protein